MKRTVPWGASLVRMMAKSTGRWCSWIWTELRPQRVMWGRPSPARWVKVRCPQTVQPGRGLAALISLRSFDHKSKERRVRRRSWGWPVRSLRASVTWMEAARFTAVERMPAVSQVSTGPEGGLGKMQAMQAVGAYSTVLFARCGTRSSETGSCELLAAGRGRMFIVAA